MVGRQGGCRIIPFDLLLAFILALVAWGLVLVARAVRALASSLADATAVLAQILPWCEAALATPRATPAPTPQPCPPIQGGVSRMWKALANWHTTASGVAAGLLLYWSTVGFKLPQTAQETVSLLGGAALALLGVTAKDGRVGSAPPEA